MNKKELEKVMEDRLRDILKDNTLVNALLASEKRKNAKLEKENEELKKKLQFYSKESANACFAHNEKSKKLKIAREIIALGLRVCETSSIEYMNLYQKQAEQFLKEIEK